MGRLPETEGHLGRAWLQSTPPGSGAQAAPCQRKASPRRTGTRSSALSEARGCGPNLRARRPRTDAPRSALGAGGGCGFCSAPQGALPRAAPRSRAAPPAPGTDKGVEEGRSGSHSQRGGRGPLGAQGGASRLRPSAGGPALPGAPPPHRGGRLLPAPSPIPPKGQEPGTCGPFRRRYEHRLLGIGRPHGLSPSTVRAHVSPHAPTGHIPPSRARKDGLERSGCSSSSPEMRTEFTHCTRCARAAAQSRQGGTQATPQPGGAGPTT